MRSPGWASPAGTCGSAPACSADWCGSETPARPQAHDVSPEQSKPTPGVAIANTHGTPSWLMAALMATPARDDAGGGAGLGATGAGAGVARGGAVARGAATGAGRAGGAGAGTAF